MAKKLDVKKSEFITSAFLFIILFIFTELACGQQDFRNILPVKYPPKYSGDDISKIIAQVKKLNAKAGKKGEFETSEEFNARLEAVTESNMFKSFTIVFKPQNLRQEYDADKSKLTVAILASDYTCPEICLKNNKKMTGTYIATNAYGAKIKVYKFDSSTIRLEVSTEKYKDTNFSSYNNMDTIVVFADKEAAKKMKGKIALAYTVYPIPPFYEVQRHKYGPTFGDPTYVSSNEQIVTIEVKKIAIFNNSTGEIYGELNIDDHINIYSKQYEECNSADDRSNCKDYLDNLLYLDLIDFI